jgi:flagellar biosynthesis GTPase FlhF
MGQDRTGNAQEARSQAESFSALTNGGSCSIIVTPGSATPKTAAGQDQDIERWYGMQMFGPVGSPEAGEIAFTLMSYSRSNEVVERLQALKARIAENQARIAQQEQQTAQSVEAQRIQGAHSLEAQKAAQAQEQTVLQEQARTAGQIAVDQQKHEQELEKALVQRLLTPPDNGPQKPNFKKRESK